MNEVQIKRDNMFNCWFYPIRKMLKLVCVGIVGAVFFPWLAWGAVNDWAEGTQDGADGATRDYYNRAAILSWENYLGDWRDSDNVAQGNKPYAQTQIENFSVPKNIELDVTSLVSEWLAGTYPNQGFFLDATAGSGPVVRV